ncbi:hypothetical protein LTR27_001525 [Elasticomyces elasticus]|nr:hypothetical protein LTR27_001525 [Elasticomyces elasticus]
MAEPRARHRARGALYFQQLDLQNLLVAFGDNVNPSTSSSLPLTISVLDEILHDFILETCHAAALCASYSRRQKIKVDDFKWALRKDEKLLGRVLEVMWKERNMKEERRVMDFDSVGKEGVGDLAGIAEAGGAGAEARKKGKKKRKRADGGARNGLNISEGVGGVYEMGRFMRPKGQSSAQEL